MIEKSVDRRYRHDPDHHVEPYQIPGDADRRAACCRVPIITTASYEVLVKRSQKTNHHDVRDRAEENYGEEVYRSERKHEPLRDRHLKVRGEQPDKLFSDERTKKQRYHDIDTQNRYKCRSLHGMSVVSGRRERNGFS